MNNILKKLINNADYVSFDIFDTLILRNVLKPNDIFYIVQGIYEKKYSKLPFNYPLYRVNAEKYARKYTYKKLNYHEIRLNEIYNKLEQYGVDKQICEQLMQLEIQTEILFTTKNNLLYSIYKYCLDQNKKIIIISDTYLSIKTIKKILSNNDYSNLKKIYLSSTSRKSKYFGTLFKYVINDLDINPSKILHIGDNLHSDIEVAKKNGIVTYHYKSTNLSPFYIKLVNKAAYIKNYLYLKKGKNISQSISNALIVNKFNVDNSSKSSVNDFWYMFGYKNIGILYYAFTKWLIKEIQKDKINKIYFLARDGYIMKKVYDIMTKDDNKSIKSNYVYASRRSLNIPGIEKMDKSALDFLISYCYGLNVAQILERVKLSSKNYTKEIRAAGFTNRYSLIKNYEDVVKAKKLFISISDDIINMAKQERNLIYKYFKQEDLFNAPNIGIIDLGWHGTLQHSLNKLLKGYNKDVQLKGYYYGIFNKAKRFINQNNLSTSSYLFNFDIPFKHYLFAKFNINMLEFIHSAPHGSVLYFKKDKKNIVPVFDKDTNKSQLTKIKVLQEGALDFIKDISKINTIYDIDIFVSEAIKPLQSTLENPNYREALHIGNIEYTEGFGDKYVKKHLAKPITLSSDLATFRKNIKNFKYSPWKIGYIKQIFRDINLHIPYIIIIKTLYGINYKLK